MKHLFKTILFALGELTLKFAQKPDKKELHQLVTYKDKIELLYSTPLYWHGTGRFQYKVAYDNPKETTQTIDVLDEILKNKGILPLVKDPWMKSNNKYKVTISLAKIRLYASVYAFMNLEEGTNPYQYGTRKFWLFIINMTNFIEEPIDAIKHLFIFTFKIGNQKLRIYQAKSRSYSKLVNMRTFFLQLFYMAKMQSDIKGNYPIIIAVKKDNLEYLEVNTGFNYFEARVDKPIQLKDISHFQVPSKNIKETQDLLNQYSINIPVMPIEATEVYNREYKAVKDLLSPEK